MKITIFAEKSVQNKTNRLNINENKTSDYTACGKFSLCRSISYCIRKRQSNGTGISLKDDPFKPETENCNLTYAAIASRYFDADCILVCHSGRGIARNYNDWGKGIARTTMPEKYEYVFDEAEGPLCEKPEQTPDLVVVYLGASMHPNYVGQKKMAFNIIPYISTITGWEMK